MKGSIWAAAATCCMAIASLSLSVAWNHIELQGYEYKGILPHPDEEELGKCFLYLSPDEKTEVLLLEYGAGGWEIFYMPTDPEDVARVEPVFG